MNKFWSILMFVIAMLTTGVVSGGEPSTEAELKARFRQRIGVLESLKDGGKVGETTEGLVEAVKAATEGESVTVPKAGKMTVGAFLKEENTDRRKLYELIGKRTDESAATVAQQAAIRNFKQAKPNHYVKLRNGQWVQKKQLPEPK